MKRFIFFAALFGFPALVSAQALSLKDVSDDVRATIVKEKARRNAVNKQQDSQGADAGDTMFGSQPAGSNGGCKMNIASPNQPSLAQRRTVVVVTAPIVQICK